MNVIPLLVLCSLALATAAVIFFVYSVRSGDHEHADRLALLPLEDDEQESATSDNAYERVRRPRG